MESLEQLRQKSVLSRRSVLGRSAAGIAAGVMATSGVRSAFAQDATPVSGEISASPGTITQARVDAMLDQLPALAQSILTASGLPGLAISIVHEDKVIFTEGFGIRDTTTGDSIDKDTIFQLASVSKCLASTVVSAVVGDGTITWDSLISDLDPGFKLMDNYASRNLTIRDCFSHRSGMHDHVGDLLEDIGYNREEVLYRIRYQAPLSSFRSKYDYTNFILTEGAVAAAASTGLTWEDLSDQRLYKPLGMTRTSSRFDDFINDANHASLHVPVDGEMKPKFIRQPDAQSPAGGVSSTVVDLAQWMRLQLASGAFDGEQIVDTDALGQTHIPHMVSNPVANPWKNRASFYGLGFGLSYDDFAQIRWSHSGAFGLGAGTTIYLLPQESFGIMVLGNGQANGTVESVALSVLDLVQIGSVQHDYLALLAPIFAQEIAPPYGVEDNYTIPPASPTPQLANDAYVGVYQNDFYGAASVVENADGLTLELGPEPKEFPMRSYDRDIFLFDPVGENAGRTSTVIFTIGADGLAADVVIDYLNQQANGTFLREVTPAAE